MLPSEAAMPPCAATVCERVGKTLVMQAVFRPCSAHAERGAQARAAGADDDDVEGVVSTSSSSGLVYRRSDAAKAAAHASDPGWLSICSWLPRSRLEAANDSRNATCVQRLGLSASNGFLHRVKAGKSFEKIGLCGKIG
jgi:hypothetical protein